MQKFPNLRDLILLNIQNNEKNSNVVSVVFFPFLINILYQTTTWEFRMKITEPDNLKTVLDLEGSVENFSNFGIFACQDGHAVIAPLRVYKNLCTVFGVNKTATV